MMPPKEINIMMLSNDKDLMNLLKGFFNKNGYQNLYEAGNSLEAQKFLAQTPFHLVVVDGDMPERNGYQFILTMKKRNKWKDIATIFITDKVRKEDIIALMKVGVTMCMLKPFSESTLLQRINEIFEIHGVVTEEHAVKEKKGSAIEKDLKKIFRKMKIPVMSAVAVKLSELIKSSDVNFKEIEKIVANDPSITGKVLRMANSSFYRGIATKDIISIREATARIGLQQLQQVVIASSLSIQGENPLVREIWQNSIARACIGSLISSKVNKSLFWVIFSAEIMHDIGAIGLAMNYEDAYRKVIDDCKSNDQHIIDLETRAFGYNHMQVGKYVGERMGLPPYLLNIIASHHNFKPVEADGTNVYDISAIILLSDILFYEQHTGSNGKEHLVELKEKIANYFGLLEEELLDALEDFPSFFNEQFEFFVQD